jgi:uncharacterized protein YggE
MYVVQSIRNPSGISVFGSYVMRVEPDVALVTFAVAHSKPEPPAAFAATRQAVADVRAYLRDADVPPADVQTSVVHLSAEWHGYGKERVFLGYEARTSLSVRLTDLRRFEEILAGVVQAGANQIQSTEFQTTRLLELRAQARRGAFAAARRKGELYAEEAGVRLGEVLHVEDVNPDGVRGRESHGADASSLESDGDALQPSTPGSIQVQAAVQVMFAIQRAKSTSGFA